MRRWRRVVWSEGVLVAGGGLLGPVASARLLLPPSASASAMDPEKMKVWLYRVQQRLAITRSEAAAVFALTGLLVAGLVVRQVQDGPRAVPGEAFSPTDHRFQEGVARLRAAQQNAFRPGGSDRAVASLSEPAASDTVRMNLNEATARQLQRLPRVGPVIAERIVHYRRKHGRFAEVGHLERVRGIGPKTMKRLTPLLFVPSAEERPLPEE